MRRAWRDSGGPSGPVGRRADRDFFALLPRGRSWPTLWRDNWPRPTTPKNVWTSPGAGSMNENSESACTPCRSAGSRFDRRPAVRSGRCHARGAAARGRAAFARMHGRMPAKAWRWWRWASSAVGDDRHVRSRLILVYDMPLEHDLSTREAARRHDLLRTAGSTPVCRIDRPDGRGVLYATICGCARPATRADPTSLDAFERYHAQRLDLEHMALTRARYHRNGQAASRHPGGHRPHPDRRAHPIALLIDVPTCATA